MTEWKLVPVEPTEEMVKSAEDYMEFIDTTGEVWDAMLAAVPKASEDEELITQLAGIISRFDMEYIPMTAQHRARRILKMLEGL